MSSQLTIFDALAKPPGEQLADPYQDYRDDQARSQNVGGHHRINFSYYPDLAAEHYHLKKKLAAGHMATFYCHRFDGKTHHCLECQNQQGCRTSFCTLNLYNIVEHPDFAAMLWHRASKRK